MFPSPADRSAWLQVVLLFGVIIALALLFGAGTWMRINLLPVLNDSLSGVSVVFAISASVHLLVLIPVWLIQRILSRLTGYRVVG
jgi:hypothetical protein